MSDKIIKVNGLEIRPNSIYKVINKPDKSAPDGFQREGSTKLPSLGIGNKAGCRYIENSNTGVGLYDTGFFTSSPCYANMEKDEVELRVALLQELIVEPYERMVGKKGTLDHSNHEFWDSYTYHLEVDRPFRSENASDLLDLFQAVLAHELTPKHEVKNPKFKQSQYLVEDVLKSKSHKEEVNNSVFNAIANFSTLHNGDKYLALKTLEYAGLTGVTESMTDSSLNSLLFSWLSSDPDNSVRFNNLYEIAKDKKKQGQIILYSKIKDLTKKGVISNITGEYYFGDVYLGGDLKTAASNVNSKTDLKEVKAEIMEK